MSNLIFDRKSGEWYEEIQYSPKTLSFLYGNVLGRLLLNGFVSRRWFTQLYALRYKSRASRRQIIPFAREHGIRWEEYEQREYSCFHDFFTRNFASDARPVDNQPNALIAPADGKLVTFAIDARTDFQVKGVNYTLAELLGRPQLAREYAGGTGLLLRLTVDDGHRYCFIDQGTIGESWQIPGRLHTVGPYSLGKVKVLAKNHRICQVLHTARFGEMICIEVGALLVGRVVNHPIECFAKGEEKGYFAYGGSTIVLLFKAGKAVIADDIWDRSAKGQETKVRRGEGIGYARQKN